jgi:phospholipase/lecithinase/hemolysin
MTNLIPTATRFQPLIARLSLLALLATFSSTGFAEKKADLSRLVVVGDSLSAGFQNGSLLDLQQPNGYASLVASQAGTTLDLPLIASPGLPNVLVLINPGPPPVIIPALGMSTGRDNTFLQAMDLAVPGANVQDALTTRPTPAFTTITDVVLGLPGLLGGVSRSQVEWAENLAPTTVLLWLGNNDALSVVFTADPATLTPVELFKAAYEEVTDRLAATGATLVLANIPDVTVIPYLTSAEKVAAQTGRPLSVVGPILGISPGDFITPDAFPLILARLSDPSLGPLPSNVVLDAGEVVIVRSRIDSYNEIIATQAQAKGAALVDIHQLLTQIQAEGFMMGGQRLTTDFLGGIFSLDGIHPTNTGYGIVANAFIKELNQTFAAAIPPVSVEQIQKSDPLVPVDARRSASIPGHISHDAVQALRAVVLH